MTGRNIALIFEKASTRTRVRLRGRCPRPGRARHLSRVQAKRTSATRNRSRTPPECSDGCSTASNSGASPKRRGVLGRVRRRARMERADRHVAPHPDAGRHPDHPRPHAQASRGCHATATSATPATTRPTRSSSPARCSDSTSASARPMSLSHPRTSERIAEALAAESGARITVDRRRRRGGRRSGLPLHRRLGLDGRARRIRGTSASSCCCPIRSTPISWRRPATRR